MRDVIPHSQHEQAHTPKRHIAPEDEEKESFLYDTFPIHIYKQPEPNQSVLVQKNRPFPNSIILVIVLMVLSSAFNFMNSLVYTREQIFNVNG